MNRKQVPLLAFRKRHGPDGSFPTRPGRAGAAPGGRPRPSPVAFALHKAGRDEPAAVAASGRLGRVAALLALAATLPACSAHDDWDDSSPSRS